MIYADNIFQPSLCSIDFSVDASESKGHTKFLNGDTLTVQLSIGGEEEYETTDNGVPIYKWVGLVDTKVVNGATTYTAVTSNPFCVVLWFNYPPYGLKKSNSIYISAEDYTNKVGGYDILKAALNEFECRTLEVSGGGNPENAKLVVAATTTNNLSSAMLDYSCFFGGLDYNHDRAYDCINSEQMEANKLSLFGSSELGITWSGFNSLYQEYYNGDYEQYPNKLMVFLLNKFKQVQLAIPMPLIKTETVNNSAGYAQTIYFHTIGQAQLDGIPVGMYSLVACLLPKASNDLDFDKVVCDSEAIEVLPHGTANTVLINFKHYKTMLGCIFNENTNYMFRVIGEPRPWLREEASNAEGFTSYDTRNIQIGGYPVSKYTLSLGGLKGLPRELLFKIMLAFQCKELIINGEPALLADNLTKFEDEHVFSNGNKTVKIKIQEKSTKYIKSANQQFMGLRNGVSPSYNNKLS